VHTRSAYQGLSGSQATIAARWASD